LGSLSAGNGTGGEIAIFAEADTGAIDIASFDGHADGVGAAGSNGANGGAGGSGQGGQIDVETSTDQIVVGARPGVHFGALSLTANGSGGAGIDFDLLLRWSRSRGVEFDGGGALEITIPLQRSLGPLQIESVTARAAVEEGKLAVEASTSASVAIGPLTALLIASAQSGDRLVAVLVFLIALRVIQDYFIYPRLVRHGMHLKTPAVILTIWIGAALAGAAGVILAIPVAGFLSVSWRHWREFQEIERLVNERRN